MGYLSFQMWHPSDWNISKRLTEALFPKRKSREVHPEEHQIEFTQKCCRGLSFFTPASSFQEKKARLDDLIDPISLPTNTTAKAKDYNVSFRINRDHFPSSVLKSDKIAQITISVGCSEKHQGPYFRDTLEASVKHFKKCFIMLDDSVQWRTLKIEHPTLSDDELKALAIQHGDEWLKQNMAYINRINETLPEDKKVVVFRWSDFDQTQINQLIQKMKLIYEHRYEDGRPHPIKKAIDDTANAFLERVKKRSPTPQSILDGQLTYVDIFDMSRDYLIEECAVMTEIWPTLGAHFELYPAQRSEAMRTSFEEFIKEKHPNLLLPAEIRFNKIKKDLVINQTTHEEEKRDVTVCTR